ncbi:hypothetical protein QUF63_17070 [Anaerolineales bacterium HSG25]|nr:hypothetical protein [Anaerolineales bacterium HSG25]
MKNISILIFLAMFLLSACGMQTQPPTQAPTAEPPTATLELPSTEPPTSADPQASQSAELTVYRSPL